MLNIISIIPIIAASISGTIGLYFIFIYLNKRIQLIHFVFGVTAISVCLYAIASCGIYNATNLNSAIMWQRTQMVSSIIFVLSFHTFITLFNKTRIIISIFLPTAFIGLLTILSQMLVRSSLTWNYNLSKTLLIEFFGRPYIFYKFYPGLITFVTLGFIAILYLDIFRILITTKNNNSTNKWSLILIVSLLIILAFINDTLITIGVYKFIYLLEISFLLLVLYFSWLLSSSVIEATFNKESLELANLELRKHRQDLEKLVSERTKEIHSQSEYFQSLFENSPIAIVALDNQQRVTSCNSAFESLFGYSSQEAQDQNLDSLIASEDIYQDAFELTQKVLNWEKITASGFRKRKDGSMVHVQISGVPVIVNGEKLGVLGLYQDITDQNRAEQILRESEVRYRSLFEDSPISLWEEDFSELKLEIEKLQNETGANFSNFIRSNPNIVKSLISKIKINNINLATLKLFKAKSKDSFYSGLDNIIPDSSISIFAEEFIALAEGKTTFISEIDQMNFDGQIIHSVLRLSLAPGYENNWEKVFVSIIDITERKIYEQNLKYHSTHDQLTGLANRTLMFELLNHAITTAKRTMKKLAVLFIDLDGFKAINDQFGHAVGDQFLNITGQRLKNCLRESDTIARVGGDEFIIILENLEDISAVNVVAEKILKTVSTPYLSDGNSCEVTTSIGISIHPDHSSDPEQLISLADTAMYRSKQKGKNQYQFTERL